MKKRPSKRTALPTPAKRMRGLSLIEVLIALIVVSVGLLGMVGLQTYALKNNNSAYHRSQANNLAYEILDQMRANRVGALGAAYKMTLGGDAPTDDSRAAIDVAHWLKSLPQFLPEGTGAIECYIDPATKSPCTKENPTCICQITVRWDDARGTATDAQQQITLSTRI